MMIRSNNFHANPETLKTNKHQKKSTDNDRVQKKSLYEHDKLRHLLEEHHIKITSLNGQVNTPDDIFCNNWLSTHEDKTFILYPMLSKNRRLERRQDIISLITQTYTLTSDLTDFEEQNVFLESTGSLVLDRVNKIAYAVRSPRTHDYLVQLFCKKKGYTPVIFDCQSPEGFPEYHTNVVMFIGSHIAAIYTGGIPINQRNTVLSYLEKSHHVLNLSYEQIKHFCGNALEVSSTQSCHKQYLIMSEKAYNSYTAEQKDILNMSYHKILRSPLDTIETYGGGSARCLLCELF